MKYVFGLAYILSCSNLLGGEQNVNSRSQLCSFINGRRLKGHLIASTTAASELSCALKCLIHSHCKSFNFGVGEESCGICELNSRTLLSQIHDPSLIHDKGFVFASSNMVSFFCRFFQIF